MTRDRLLPLVSAVLLLAACDRPGAVTSVADPAAAPPAGVVALTCTATVRTGSIECRPARGTGARADLLLGGQWVRVKLASSNVSYDGATETLRTDVTVQNLLSQAIGTPDGTTVEGVRVFFHSLPTVTDGSGTVAVQNPDGVGTFTAANQPFFLYDQILTPRGTSAARTWRFTVPATAATFVFSVYVAAAAAGESGILRWIQESGRPLSPYLQTGVWGASDSSVFMVAHSNGISPATVAHWNGQAWTELLVSTRADDQFSGVSGTSSHDVFVATGTPSMLRYDGNEWTRYEVGTSRLTAVWAAAPGDAFAVGWNQTVQRWNGTSWTRMTTPSAPAPPHLFAVWGSSASDVFAVGSAGTILHWNGSAWTRMTSNTTAELRGVWGSSPTDVWAVGGSGTIHHYDGVSWSETASEVQGLQGVWGRSATDVYVVGGDDASNAAMLHWDGAAWTPVALNHFGPLTSIWGSPAGRMVAVGSFSVFLTKEPGGSWVAGGGHAGDFLDLAVGSASDVIAAGNGVAHWNGAAWNTLVAPGGSRTYHGAWYDGAGTFWLVGTSGSLTRVANGVVQPATSIAGTTLLGVWGTGPSNVFVVGNGGAILRSTGGAFSPMSSGTTQQLLDVWGSSATSVFAVGGNGVIRRYDGTSWSAMASGTTATLAAVHGTGPSDVWAVGTGGTVLHYDGSAWTAVPSGTTATLHSVWAAPNGVVYAGGDGVLMRYADGAWAPYAPLSYSILGLDGLSGTDVYAAGSFGLVLHGLR